MCVICDILKSFLYLPDIRGSPPKKLLIFPRCCIYQNAAKYGIISAVNALQYNITIHTKNACKRVLFALYGHIRIYIIISLHKSTKSPKKGINKKNTRQKSRKRFFIFGSPTTISCSGIICKGIFKLQSVILFQGFYIWLLAFILICCIYFDMSGSYLNICCVIHCAPMSTQNA